jgi:hypothetical protein
MLSGLSSEKARCAPSEVGCPEKFVFHSISGMEPPEPLYLQELVAGGRFGTDDLRVMSSSQQTNEHH